MSHLKLGVLAVLLACGVTSPGWSSDRPLERVEQRLEIAQYVFDVKVPAGYVVEHLTGAMSAPRILTFHHNGDLYAGSNSGHIYHLQPPYTQPKPIIRVRGYPHSIAFRAGKMLIALTSGLYEMPYQPGQRPSGDSIKLLAAIPGGPGHSSRTVKIGPDNKIYLSLGISGNCSDEYLHRSYPPTQRRGGVMVLDESLEPPEWKTFGSGLRNPVGFSWHPDTREMYASNNGPDHLGYEQPPEVFAHVTPGSFHGMPWFQMRDGNLAEDSCITRAPPRSQDEVALPVATFPSRSAPMDVTFAQAETVSGIKRGDAIVALKGSWATLPDGGGNGDPATRRPPRIVVVQFEAGKATSVVDLVTGFQLADGRRWARPVGVAFGPEGALYFTSDTALEGLYRLRKAADNKR